MIQIYRPENTKFEMNGDNTLTPLLAEVTATLNDLWCASVKHPIDQEGRWKFITEDAVVKMPSFNGDQLFRIRNVYKSDSSVECSMEPIFYDSIDDCFIEDIRPTGLKGQLALNAMLAPNEKYKATSDVKKISTAYYQDVNFMEALNGDIDQSFINRWGGEILYDNFTVIVNERVGSDNGVELRYGKNIKKNGLSEEIDTRSVVTRIKPKAYNGYTMTGRFVDSPYIDKYPTVRTRTMKFEDVKMAADAMEGDEENGVIICNTQEELDAALREKCEKQYELGLDKPTVTIKADMILLQNTEEYKEFVGLEQVSLGDTIHCIHDVLEIVSDARIVSLKYDSIKEKVTSVTIGDFKHDYFDQLSSSTGRIESEVQNLIEQIENPNSEFQKSMQKLIDDMAASISGNNGGNMVITQNSEGKPNGIMIMDTESKETAKKILYFNLNGISYSNNGVDGPYNAVWSFEKGGFIADWIVTGNILANVIKGGTLTLGGSGNGNGILSVLDASGNEISKISKDGIETSNIMITGGKINMISSNKGYIAIDLKSENSSAKTRLRITPSGITILLQYSTGEKYYTGIDSQGFHVGTFSHEIFDDSVFSTMSKVYGTKSMLYDGNAYSGDFYDKNGKCVTVQGGLIRSVG